MRSKKAICAELTAFVEEPNRDFKLTYETKWLEAIFELLLDIRDTGSNQIKEEKRGEKKGVQYEDEYGTVVWDGQELIYLIQEAEEE